MGASPFTVMALIAAYNEEDIIGQVIGDLVRQGVRTYLLDQGSTDDTVAEARRYLGKGLLEIESAPSDRFSLARILERKEVLARELDADWFINHDADEFRESPWPHLSLAEAIRQVDRFGYDAIDFELLNFVPTHDRFRRGDDVREAFPYYEPGAPWDRVQIRCWKKTDEVELVSTGGHEAVFEGRKVFPLRFLLRHYPIRSQTHGERKILRERRPRFDEGERERGWHRQYDPIPEGYSFVRDPRRLIAYDPEGVRLQLVLRHRAVEDLEQTPEARERAEGEWRRRLDALCRELDGRNQEAARLARELDARNREADRLGLELDARNVEVDRLGRQLDARNREAERLARELDARNREADRLGHELDTRNHEFERLNSDVEAKRLELEQLATEATRLRAEMAAATEEQARLRQDAAALETALLSGRAELDALLSSRSWRWTAPLRAAHRRLSGRQR